MNLKKIYNKIGSIQAKRLVLFGAADWGKKILEALNGSRIPNPVIFADNDITKHGKQICGHLIVSPQTLNPKSDVVIIATISAGDRVSMQLEQAGFKRNENYFEVLHNLDVDYPFGVLNFFSQYVESFEGKDILHIGPGGNLGVEILLKAIGAKSIVSVEYDSYGIHYPDITEVKWFYDALHDKCKEKLDIDFDLYDFFLKKGNRLRMNTNAVSLLFPCSVTHLPFRDNTFECVLHNTVFEHVYQPQLGYSEIYRVLKPGGFTVGLVDPQDHRVFSSVNGYHPLSFLKYSRDQWYDIVKHINFHNQITSPEHKQMILDSGLKLQKWDIHEKMDVSDKIWDTFHPMFKTFERSELGVLRFAMMAQK